MVLILIVLTISLNVFAQDKGVISGAVTDENGAKIAGAHVLLTSTAVVQLNTTTDQYGCFEFKDVPSGSYFIEV
jgi:hypothetical protein